MWFAVLLQNPVQLDSWCHCKHSGYDEAAGSTAKILPENREHTYIYIYVCINIMSICVYACNLTILESFHNEKKEKIITICQIIDNKKNGKLHTSKEIY